MAKKKYQVIRATRREIPGVYVGGQKRMFGKNGSFTVSDPGEAAEINKVLGAKGTGEVVVVSNTEKEHGHKYTFGSLTSQEARDNYDRIFRKPNRNATKRRKGAEVTKRKKVKHDDRV